MDKKSKIFIFLFFLFAGISVFLTYYRVMVLRDYIISVDVDCDPSFESCFVTECDPLEDETCSENPEERLYYYKIINKNFKNIVPCDAEAEECPVLACEPAENDCEVILCDENELLEGESCSNQLNSIENSIEENGDSNNY